MPITCDGAFPLRSAWLSTNRRGVRNLGANPRKVVNIAPVDSANAPVWTDFFFAPSGPATQNLTPALFTNTNSFYSPTVAINSGTVLVPALFTNTNSFYAATVGGRYALAPALFVNSHIFYSAACYLYPFNPSDLRPGAPSAAPGPREPLPVARSAAREAMPTATSPRTPIPPVPNGARGGMPLSSAARQTAPQQ